MNRPTSPTGWPLKLVGLLLLAGLLVAGLPAAAQVIKVTSAVPAEADQGVVGLVVTIGGESFPSNSKVAFYVSGTKNPGGIAVKAVRFKDSKTLEATIDVAPDAQTDLKFDIQVMSGSRTGKGTELFKVLVKVTGGDLTPPGTITTALPGLLRIVDGTLGYNSATLEWMAPANDGFEASSGPATQYDIRVRKDATECGGPFTMAVWVDSSWTGPHADPCHAFVGWPAAGAPGTTESRLVFGH